MALAPCFDVTDWGTQSTVVEWMIFWRLRQRLDLVFSIDPCLPFTVLMGRRERHICVVDEDQLQQRFCRGNKYLSFVMYELALAN